MIRPVYADEADLVLQISAEDGYKSVSSKLAKLRTKAMTEIQKLGLLKKNKGITREALTDYILQSQDKKLIIVPGNDDGIPVFSQTQAWTVWSLPGVLLRRKYRHFLPCRCAEWHSTLRRELSTSCFHRSTFIETGII